MIEASIFKNLEKCNIHDFRYLMYLSRNNAWVKVGGDLFKLTITDLIETITTTVGTTTHFDKQFHPIAPRGDAKLKLFLSQRATSLDIFGRGSSQNIISASKHKILPNMKFNAISEVLTCLCISMEEKQISLKVTIENFDYDFLKTFSELKTTDETKLANFLKSYDDIKNQAESDALNNAIWFAAVSGDNQQLGLLLDNAPKFDLQSTYQGKNLIEAMFKADPKQDLPFLTNTNNYRETIKMLIQRGFDLNQPVSPTSNQSSLDVCNLYQEQQNNLSIFQSYNPVHVEILKEINGEHNRNQQTQNTYSYLRGKCILV